MTNFNPRIQITGHDLAEMINARVSTSTFDGQPIHFAHCMDYGDSAILLRFMKKWKVRASQSTKSPNLVIFHSK